MTIEEYMDRLRQCGECFTLDEVEGSFRDIRRPGRRRMRETAVEKVAKIEVQGLKISWTTSEFGSGARWRQLTGRQDLPGCRFSC